MIGSSKNLNNLKKQVNLKRTPSHPAELIQGASINSRSMKNLTQSPAPNNTGLKDALVGIINGSEKVNQTVSDS